MPSRRGALNRQAPAYPQWRDGSQAAMTHSMAEIVNLRLARKARDRKAAETRAAQNRAVHGRSGAERAATRAERERLARAVDGARRERDDQPDAG